jgi:hypothetical protein
MAVSRPIPPAIFALKAWRIKKRGDKFFISPAVIAGAKWGKSYRSLQAACSAVARKLAEEWTQRNERLRNQYRGSKERPR